MKERTTALNRVSQRQVASIKTTFMELLQTLTQLTQDDALVIAAMKDIFQSHNVRLEHSLAPVRLAPSDPAAQKRRSIGAIRSAAKRRNWKIDLL